jgi:hemolysin activation/secretion protein
MAHGAGALAADAEWNTAATPPQSAVVAQTGSAAPTGSAAAEKTETAPVAAPNHFDVHEYRVLGNTTLPNRDIESVLYPLLGDHKTLADVEIARAALEKAYHDHGFGTVFVDIPEQTVDEQIVRLQVTEGRLHEVRASGARYFSERKILASIPAATAGTVPNVPELQKQISAASVLSADRQIVPVLRAGPYPGTVDLALQVNDKLPLHGSLEVNNQNTPNTETLRSTISLSYADLFAERDNLSAQYQFSPQDTRQVKVIAANYAWGSLPNGLRPSVTFVDSNSNVPAFSTLGVLGKGQVYSTRLAFPLTDAPGMPQSITIGADYKHFLQSITVPAAAGSQAGPTVANTPISYSNLSLSYSGLWSSEAILGSFASAANFGPRGAPNNPNAFANKAFKSEPNYFYVRVDGFMSIRLPVDFRVSLRMDGQYAVEPLINNEAFSITGANAVRGYLEAESLTDTGIVGSVELQSPVWRVKTLSLGDVFVFFDEGHGHVINPLPGQASGLTLRSWGAGVNLLPGSALTGALTWAYPLVSGPDTRRDDSRLLFTVRGAF